LLGNGGYPAIHTFAADLTRGDAARAKPVKCRYFSYAALFNLLWLITACEPTETSDQTSDFAVLAQQAETFAQAKPGKVLSFPSDHGPHPDYRIEWWYLTANLLGPGNETYGVQWTLFRLAVSPQEHQKPQNIWQSDQLFMAHMAITTPTAHLSFQRYARGAENGQSARSGVTARPFSAWLDDWILESTGTDWLPLEVRARQDDDAFHLQLEGDMPLVLQGDAGFSQKHADGGGSYYYSQPFLKATGELTFDGETIPVSGAAWLDREWGSQFLQRDQVGWDWFSLHLENGEKLMLFQLRENAEANSGGNFVYGSLISTNGTRTDLDPRQIRLEVLGESKVMDRDLPLQWRIELPQINRQFTIGALHTEQWMDVDFPYWEGVVRVNGNGPPNRGMGYMELTGYPTGTKTSP
jgi:predicted secreted hydrolase